MPSVSDKMTVLADRGYFKGEEILQCAQEGITTLVPKPLTSNSKADGRFDKRDFIYDAKRDEYRCPAGERAIWRMTTVENGLHAAPILAFGLSRDARSSLDAHPAITGESRVGNTSRCWTICSTAWTALQRLGDYDGRPSSIHSER